MKISELIIELKEKEIHLSYTGSKLKYCGPEENITPELIGKLKKYKRELIKYFSLDEFSNILFFNAGGNKTPLFLVHGDNFNYSFSDYLGPDQPVFGFFHPGSEGEVIVYKNVHQMAKAYLDKVLTFNPVGPFYLIGFSFGGVLAFEMAVQLQKLGHEIPVLVLIDSFSPLAKMPKNWRTFFPKLIKRKYWGQLKWRFEVFIRLLICKAYILIKNPIPKEERKYYILDKYKKLNKGYEPEKYNGEILLIRFSDNKSSYKYLGWESLVKTINLITVEGNHIKPFQDKKSVEKLQTEIKKYIVQKINNKKT